MTAPMPQILARILLARGASRARSSVAVGLPVHKTISGALNVYSTRPEVFDGNAVELACTFAGYAAVGCPTMLDLGRNPGRYVKRAGSEPVTLMPASRGRGRCIDAWR